MAAATSTSSSSSSSSGPNAGSTSDDDDDVEDDNLEEDEGREGHSGSPQALPSDSPIPRSSTARDPRRDPPTRPRPLHLVSGPTTPHSSPTKSSASRNAGTQNVDHRGSSRAGALRDLVSSQAYVREQWDRKVWEVVGVQTDGKWVVLGSGDNVLQVYRLHRPTPPAPLTLVYSRTLYGHTAGIAALRVADGRCVSVGKEGRIRVWDLDTSDERGVGRALGSSASEPWSPLDEGVEVYADAGRSEDARSVDADEGEGPFEIDDDDDEEEGYERRRREGRTVVFNDRRILSMSTSPDGPNASVWRFDW